MIDILLMKNFSVKLKEILFHLGGLLFVLFINKQVGRLELVYICDIMSSVLQLII